MKIELRYFSGTGNSWLLLNQCKSIFEASQHTVNINSLDTNELEINADLIGFAFPIYSFGIPHIVRNYIRSLNPFKEKQKVFFIITAGAVMGSSLSTKKFEQLLIPKNAEIIYSEVIKMPNNWIPFSHTLSEEENKIIIENGKEKAIKIANDILIDHKAKFDLNQIPPFFKTLGSTVNILFRQGGRKFLKSMFEVYDTCNSCELCAQVCPTKCIVMKNGKPKWNGDCEQCMRCVNICPQQSIYQKMGGHTKGKDRYMAPGFRSLITKNNK